MVGDSFFLVAQQESHVCFFHKQTTSLCLRNIYREQQKNPILSRCDSTTNGNEILENLLKLNFHVLLKVKRINLETSVYV